MLHNYFNAEMRLLQDAAQEFAKRYPEEAGLLAIDELKDHDPHVERLLEGVAFLTANIRARIDDDLPDISETLLQQIAPQLLRPIPALTILKFIQRDGYLKKIYQLPKGVMAVSNPVGQEKAVCRFQTTSPVMIVPLRIISMNMNTSSSIGTVFKLQITTDHNVLLRDLHLSTLRFYINADVATALQVYLVLCGKVQRVYLYENDAMPEKRILLGGQEVITPAHYADDDTTLPTEGNSFHGFNLLLEYFSCREKFYFLDIKKIASIPWSMNSKSFTLEIHSSAAFPNDMQINEDTLQLNCTPAINLYQSTSEPIRFDNRRNEYTVRTNPEPRESVCLYSVDDVTGIELATGKQYQYLPVRDFSHLAKKAPYFLTFSRKSSSMYPDTTIVCVNETADKSQHISCAITVCNGYYPGQYLSEHAITHTDTSVPNNFSVTNLTRPSKMYLPPNREYFQWHVIAYLSLNFRALSDIESLRQLLHLHDRTDRVENKRRIEALKELTITKISYLCRGIIKHGVEYRLLVQEHGFISCADIYFFGCVLKSFLTQYVTFNCFIMLKILCIPSNEEFIWM